MERFNDHKKVNNNLSTFNRSISSGTISESKRKKRNLLVQIHAFVLMPNHYHLLLSPLFDEALPIFLKKINMGYAKYFNEKNKRTGALFQGKTKRIVLNKDSYYMHIPHYIHCNPLDLNPNFSAWRNSGLLNPKDAFDYLSKYRWSSFPDYIGTKNFPSITNRTEFKSFFKDENSGYAKAIESFLKDRSAPQKLLTYLEFEK